MWQAAASRRRLAHGIGGSIKAADGGALAGSAAAKKAKSREYPAMAKIIGWRRLIRQ
jgi:hypothetical protein